MEHDPLKRGLVRHVLLGDRARSARLAEDEALCLVLLHQVVDAERELRVPKLRLVVPININRRTRRVVRERLDAERFVLTRFVPDAITRANRRQGRDDDAADRHSPNRGRVGA